MVSSSERDAPFSDPIPSHTNLIGRRLLASGRRVNSPPPDEPLVDRGYHPLATLTLLTSTDRSQQLRSFAMTTSLTPALFCLFVGTVLAQDAPPYVKHCKGSDPKLIDCIIKALHHLRPYLAKGIPEIQMPTVEPFRMEDLSLALTSGPNGYKIVLRDMDIFGASNFTVQKLKLGHNGAPFEAKIKIPRLNLNAKYTSTGVLIILPASGNGTFHANLGDIQANVRGTVSEFIKGGKNYLRVDKLDFDLAIKETRMQVQKIFNNNRILTEATNLFLRENGQEILKIMMPQLKTKLALVFKKVSNQLLSNVPIDVFYTED
ncbi:hypothetical protein GE061_002600 [Apolygus lucorum]|uniref:Uncharacterized protein n=1 Tax=Apolygus lucorum TaxID=248454 RepID=A0A6A4JFE4_APOLU|nr:hypothetical protein GE061_002600 [Apolygus lucorum]